MNSSMSPFYQDIINILHAKCTEKMHKFTKRSFLHDLWSRSCNVMLSLPRPAETTHRSGREPWKGCPNERDTALIKNLNSLIDCRHSLMIINYVRS